MSNDKKSNSQLKFDGHKMMFHLDRVQDWQNGKEVNPIYVAFSPSSLCNHKCTFCVYHYKDFEPIFFPLERYRELVQEWRKLDVRSIFFAGDGEPLLNKDCVEMIALTRQAGIDIAMNSNGRLLTKEKNKVLVRDLDWVRFSINAGSANTYSKVHRTDIKDFERVQKNIEQLVKEKKATQSSIVIGVQCVLLNENKHEIKELALWAKEAGVDYLAVKPFIQHPEAPVIEPLKEKESVLNELKELRKLGDESFQFILRDANFRSEVKREYCKCLSGDFMIEIDARGDVYSCGPYIGKEDHRYGNILKQSFIEMWRSDECRNKIKKIQTQLDVSKCMPFCRPDSVNKFLWSLKNPPNHVNFI